MTIDVAITAVKQASRGGISHYRWLQISNGKAGNLPTTDMIAYVERHPGLVGVGGSQGWATVYVVNGVSGKYLRSAPDSTTTDNLDELPSLA